MAVVSARIRVEVEVEVGTWNGQSTFDELQEQVRKEGRTLADYLFAEGPRRTKGRVVGTPKVLFVQVSE